MVAQTNETKIHDIPFGEIVQLLNRGVEDMLKVLKSVPKASVQSYYVEIENINQFLETLGFICETMPSDRLQDTIYNTIHSLRKAIGNIPFQMVTEPNVIPLDPQSGLPEFLIKAIHLLGPHIRISKNEMSAWVRLGREEAIFYTPEILASCLHNFGVRSGILEDNIQSLFDEEWFDQEIQIAKSAAAEMGEDGRIDYVVDVDDLGQKPKELSSYKVSFKDIKLYEYIRAGDVLAKNIPPKPGKTGFTVTSRTLFPVEAQKAEFPDLEYTKISDDTTRLLVTEDCCIKKINGQLHLEPSLRVTESVSYKTGNVSSTVAVVADKDVLSGFSLVSESSIHVGGIVEGARLEAKGSIIIRGGIQGKEKAVIDANGDITAKYISNATTNALGNTIVEKEIVNSTVWSGGQVFVTGQPGSIVSGVINADSDVVANTIGSELGIKTVIRIGGRAQDLAVLIRETQDKIAEQEDAVDKCNQIIDMLRVRESQSAIPDTMVRKSQTQARTMLKKAEENLKELYLEYDSLQKQYEDSLQKSRTVRARVTVNPGTVIQFQDVELIIKSPTGPTMFLKQGGEIVQLPYQEIQKEKNNKENG